MDKVIEQGRGASVNSQKIFSKLFRGCLKIVLNLSQCYPMLCQIQSCLKVALSCLEVVPKLSPVCPKVVKKWWNFHKVSLLSQSCFVANGGAWGMARKHSRLVENIKIEDGIVCLDILSLLMNSVIWRKKRCVGSVIGHDGSWLLAEPIIIEGLI